MLGLFSKRRSLENPYALNEKSKREDTQMADQLFETPTIDPLHDEIELPDIDSGIGRFAGVKDALWGFDHFSNFPDYVHKFSDPEEVFDIGPWRLQQISDPYLSIGDNSDGPIAGLRFRVFYNSEMVGQLQIRPYSMKYRTIADGFGEGAVMVDLFPVLFLPFRHVSGLLHCVSEPFSFGTTGEIENDRRIALQGAMNEAVWEGVQRETKWVPLDFYHSGCVLLGDELSA